MSKQSIHSSIFLTTYPVQGRRGAGAYPRHSRYSINLNSPCTAPRSVKKKKITKIKSENIQKPAGCSASVRHSTLLASL